MIKKGFTLIELLVVIAIIGILAAMVVVNVGDSRTKARDAKRVSDLDTINSAIQMYAEANGGSYPNSYTYRPANPWLTSLDQNSTTPWIPGLVPTYLSVLPVDPINKAFTATTDGGYYIYISNGTDYKLATSNMESGTGQAKAINDGGARNTCPANLSSVACWYEIFTAGYRGL